jgi:hypothetical protein
MISHRRVEAVRHAVDDVCRLIKEFGPREAHPDVAPILTLHDRLTGVEADRPLA